MNPLNYASLEASKRLVDAGIVLETEFCRDMACNPNKITTWPVGVDKGHPDFYPAPSMAEVWRELPVGASINVGTDGFSWCRKHTSPDIINTNSTDALIDLLIWVRKEGGRNDHNSR